MTSKVLNVEKRAGNHSALFSFLKQKEVLTTTNLSLPGNKIKQIPRAIGRECEEALVLVTVQPENYDALRRLDPDSEFMIVPSEEQLRILEALDIDLSNLNLHHPVPRRLWKELERFKNCCRSRTRKSGRKNDKFEKIKTILEKRLAIKCNSQKEFVTKIEELERQYGYKRSGSVPRKLHEAYNTVFDNASPRRVIQGLISIFHYDNYDRSKQESLLTLLYTFAVLRGHGEICQARKKTIEDRLENKTITMGEVLEKLGLNLDIVEFYVKIFFLPKNYEEMEGFYSMLEEICGIGAHNTVRYQLSEERPSETAVAGQ